MDSEIARIAWRMEALAAELQTPGGHEVPGPMEPMFPAQAPAPLAYPPMPQNWFANVMQASAMGMDVNREVVLLAEATQRTFGAVLHRLAGLERRCSEIDDFVRPEPVAPGAAIETPGADSTPEGPIAASVEAEELFGKFVQELDARLGECRDLQLSVLGVGEQLQAIGDRIERLERTSDESNPVLEALVESVSRLQLLDEKLDASLASVQDVARLAERLEGDRLASIAMELPVAGDSTDLSEGGEGATNHLTVLEDLPFDDQPVELVGERRGLFRRSTPEPNSW